MDKLSSNEKESGFISDLYQDYCCYDNFLLTKRGSLIGAIELKGKDPDGLTSLDFKGLGLIARSLYQDFDDKIIFTQYCVHFNGKNINFKKRTNEISNILSTRRANFLNKSKMSDSRVIHFFEILPSEKLVKLNPLELSLHFLKSIYSAESRKIVKLNLSQENTLSVYLEELEKQSQQLCIALDDAVSKWENIAQPNQISLLEIFKFSKFLCNYNVDYLHRDYECTYPDKDWDLNLPDGDINSNVVNNTEMIKINGSVPTYVRIGAVNEFGEKFVKWGLFAANKGTISRLKENFLLMIRFQPLSNFKKAMMFQQKEVELSRKDLGITSIFQDQNKTELEKRALMKPAIKDALEELEQAEKILDHWGKVHCYYATWNESPTELNKSCVALKRSADKTGLQSCWENIGLNRAYQTMQLGGRYYSLRDITFTTKQLGAASLFYRASTGQEIVEDLNNDEALYTFISDDGSPFYYSPWVNGRAVVIGVGPIRSGKSFTKNTLASHFPKYNGFIQGLDIDEGMTPIAQIYGENGGVFSINENDTNTFGFNPFVACNGENDFLFINHIKNLILMMISTNDNEELRKLDSDEQIKLDKAIKNTILLPKEFHTLSTVIKHCPESFKIKMSRWITDVQTGERGMYADYFDNTKDSIGTDYKQVMAYNLRAIKDDQILLPLVMTEIFFRTIRLFESEKYRHVPKYFDVDEAHVMLKIDYVRNFLVRSIRTWGKYLGGMGLWSQNPLEFKNLPDWSAILSSASTLFFMADPEMDVSLYKETFLLTDGECEAIKSLRPKREAFIIQRDLGVAKKVILDVENEQYIISTSKNTDVLARNRNFNKYGFTKGLGKTLEELNLSPTNID